MNKYHTFKSVFTNWSNSTKVSGISIPIFGPLATNARWYLVSSESESASFLLSPSAYIYTMIKMPMNNKLKEFDW